MKCKTLGCTNDGDGFCEVCHDTILAVEETYREIVIARKDRHISRLKATIRRLKGEVEKLQEEWRTACRNDD